MLKLNRIVIFILILCLSGCKSTGKLPPKKWMNASEDYQIIDFRPRSEKWSRNLKEDGLYRYGDNSFNTPPVRVLQDQAYHALGQRIDAKDIRVNHLAIYGNSGLVGERQAKRARGEGIIWAVFGPVGGILASLTVAIKNSEDYDNLVEFSKSAVIPVEAFAALETLDDEALKAQYTAEENPQGLEVDILYIDTTIKGKRILTKTLATRFTAEENHRIATSLDEAIKYHLAQYKQL